MISKELLNIVVYDNSILNLDTMEFEIKDEYLFVSGYKKINIHELAHKCKEWAYTKGYRIIEVQKGAIWVVPNKYNILMSFHYEMIVYQDTDIESACQWILDNEK